MFTILIFGVATCQAEELTGLIRLASGATKTVRFKEINGRAIFEGDIDLGPAAELVKAYKEKLSTGAETRAVIINGTQYRWPSFQIAYTIDPSAASYNSAISDAIHVWNTDIHNVYILFSPWTPRTNQTNYVTFTALPSGDSCSSSVGMQKGRQLITLVPGCDAGRIMHEMGHTMGLWHEQSRSDRDRYVQINYSNIAPADRMNFDQHIFDGGIESAYDYGSIMHYGAYDFAINPSVQTIISPQPIGQRLHPSPSDVNGVVKPQQTMGWGLRICDGTQAQAINFSVGVVNGSTTASRFWYKWLPGYPREVQFPPDLYEAQKIYIKGEGDPHAQINLCIVYNGAPKQGMTFNKDEDKTVGRDESTNGCLCQ